MLRETIIQTTIFLENEFVRNRFKSDEFFFLVGNFECTLWWLRLSLETDTCASCLSLFPFYLVIFHSVQEVFTGLGWFHVLHSHIDPLGNDSPLHPLVHNHTQTTSRHVKHPSSSPVVRLHNIHSSFSYMLLSPMPFTSHFCSRPS